MYLEPFKLKVHNFEDVDVYLDDTISMIKQKIYTESQKSTKIHSLYEMYLCIEIKEKLNVETIYKTLSRNEQIKITTSSLRSFFKNIKEAIVLDDDKDETKEYTLSDLYNIFNPNYYYTIYKPIGQRFGINNNVNINEYIMVPAYLTPEIYIPPNIYVTTLHNEEVLLNYINGYTHNDVEVINSLRLHVFFLGDIINEIPPSNLRPFIEVYYPLLFDKNVVDIDSYNRTSAKLLKMSKKIFDSNIPYYDYMNNFINIPNDDLYRPIKSGITKLRMKCNISSLKHVKFPLDYIYKSIHASDLFPFIKYCASSKQEQLIRLHIMDNGFPMLKKSEINKIMVTLKKIPGISVYVTMNPNVYKDVVLLFELYENGKINVSFNTINTNPYNTQDCITDILNLVNIFSEMINTCLINYDYRLPFYDTTQDNTNIIITNVNYSELYESDSFTPYIPDIKRPVVPVIFYPLMKNKLKEVKMLNDLKYYYTRISNFNSEEEFNEQITPYSDISFNINTKMLCISVNNVSSLLYIILLKEYIAKYIILMNDKGLLNKFKTYGILKYNVNVEDNDIEQLHNEQQMKLLNADIEEFENAEVDGEVDDFVKELLGVQNETDNGSTDSNDEDLNYDFDTELGDLDTI